MAYIRKHRGGAWRVEVFKHGMRHSKVLSTELDAQDWATLKEAELDAQHSIARRPAFAVAINAPDLVTAVPRVILEAMRTVPHKPMEVIASAIPCRRASGVYFLLRQGEVVYVGQSVDALGRIARHRREGRRFDAYALIECEPSELDDLERQYIRVFVPEGNLTMGAGVRRSRPALTDV